MPSAPNAEEIATRFPNVSNAHARVWPGSQFAAANCKFAILSFTEWTPRQRSSLRPAGRHLPPEIQRRHTGLSRIASTESRDRQDVRPRLPPAVREQAAGQRAGDPRLLSDELAGAWW